MTSTTFASRPAPSALPLWMWAAVSLGLLWNVYGVVQFVGTVTATREKLMAMGMTADQATLYAGLPAWMSAVFALGVFGGTLGCLLLLARRRAAVPVFAASLVGYVALFIGDIVLGVFAAIGISQVVILSVVVAIAVGLLLLARGVGRRLGWARLL